jgi:hypothetical protein
MANPAPISPIEPTFDKSPAPFGAGLRDAALNRVIATAIETLI